MTARDVKRGYEKYHRMNGTQGHFFDRDTMRFFGDTMSNFGVRDGCVINTYSGEQVEVWDLYRRRPVNGGIHGHCAYFRKDTFQEVDGVVA
jgi:hypothetical protein